MDRVQKIKAIPTKYKGVVFRSRLEARWAVYFDFFGIKWEYEYQGFELESGCYLPDFWLPELKHWAEVKPDKLTELEELKVEQLVIGTETSCILLIGSPRETPYPIIESLDNFSDEEDEIIVRYSTDFDDPYGVVYLEKDSLTFNHEFYEDGCLFGSGKTLIRDVVICSANLHENRLWHSSGINIGSKLDGFFGDVEEAVSKSLSYKF